MTISRDIHFATAKLICDKAMKTIVTSVQHVVQTYHTRSFKAHNILGNGGIKKRAPEIYQDI